MEGVARDPDPQEGRQEMTSADDLIVTSEHLRGVPGYGKRPGFCVDRSRAWFQRHDLNFRDFLRNGIPATTLEATGCAMAQALVDHAREVEGSRGRE